MCSTPFGIIGCCASRLWTYDIATNTCSTPFGIIGCCAQRPGRAVAVLIRVLNAFRHHRLLRAVRRLRQGDIEECSTPFGIIGCCAPRRSGTWPRNWVLNAFRHHRLLRTAPQGSLARTILVLNAFRHHRLLRNPTECLTLGLGEVLNAFRHHRLLRWACRRPASRMRSAQRLSAS